MVKRILIVDDNADTRQLVSIVLERFGGYGVLCAENARRGLSLAVTGKPDLILMDLQMPGVNGYEAVCRLRQQPDISHIPVIGVSGVAADVELDPQMRSVCQAYLVKPFDIQRLLTLVDEVLARNGEGS